MTYLNKTKLSIFTVAVVAAALLLLVGQGLARNATPVVFQDAGAIYAEKCAKCHGADGKGVEKMKKNGIQDFTTAKWQKANTDAKIAAAINNGKGDFMPAWKGKLKPAEVTALVKHIRAMGKK